MKNDVGVFHVTFPRRCEKQVRFGEKTIFADGGKNEKEREREGEREDKTILLKIEKP